MKAFLLPYLVDYAIDLLRRAAERTTNTIDDDVVDTIEENRDVIIELLEERI